MPSARYALRRRGRSRRRGNAGLENGRESVGFPGRLQPPGQVVRKLPTRSVGGSSTAAPRKGRNLVFFSRTRCSMANDLPARRGSQGSESSPSRCGRSLCDLRGAPRVLGSSDWGSPEAVVGAKSVTDLVNDNSITNMVMPADILTFTTGTIKEMHGTRRQAIPLITPTQDTTLRVADVRGRR